MPAKYSNSRILRKISRPIDTSIPATMGNYVYRKFPQLICAIQALREKDRAFSEACADYEEMCVWLAAQEHLSAPPLTEEWAHAQALKRDLECEILKMLEEHDDFTN